MRAIRYKDELYIRCVPGKSLFHSTMVHEVVNRGDVFCLRISDQQLTIVPGNAAVEHIWLATTEAPAPKTKTVKEMLAQAVIRRTQCTAESAGMRDKKESTATTKQLSLI